MLWHMHRATSFKQYIGTMSLLGHTKRRERERERERGRESDCTPESDVPIWTFIERVTYFICLSVLCEGVSVVYVSV